MAFRRVLLCATAVSICLLSGQTLAAKNNNEQVSNLEKKIAHLQDEIDAIDAKQSTAKKKSKSSHKQKKVEQNLTVLGHMVQSGVTVSTTPFLGLRDGNVLYNVPSMNEDLRILKQRERLEKQLNKLGTSLNKKALIGISGALEGYFIEQNNWKSKWSGNTDLGTAELDIGIMAGSWIDGFMSITYDSTSMETGSRVPNNVLYLQRGFLTIGNLQKSPFYFSIGQMYAPFGRYASAMLTTPLTKSMGRISARTAVLGYSKGSFFAQVYGFNSASRNTAGWPTDEGGVNLGGEFDNGIRDIKFGVGAVSNIADSQGSLSNGASGGYTGFAHSGSNFVLKKEVPAVDAYGEYTRGNWNIIAEVLSAVDSYASFDMFYGATNNGATPGAVHAEVDYATHFFSKPATFAVTYGQTWEAVAMNLPRYSVAMVYDVQAWKRAAIGIEVRHDINYKAGTVGGGATGVAPGSSTSIAPVCEGSSRDIVTMRFGLYF